MNTKYTFLSFILISLLSLRADAFTFNNSAKLTFSKNEVFVNVAAGFCSNLGITDEEFLDLVGVAVDKFWNTTPTSRLKLRKGSLVNVSSDFKNGPICVDSTNCEPNPDLAVPSDILISCNTNSANFSGPTILGITIPNKISGNTIIGSLILINDDVSNLFDTKSREEKISILAHEIGHAFGLGHSPVTDSLMYFATMSKRSALGRDDMDGISYLYPKEQPFSGCGTIDTNYKDPPNNWWGGLFMGFSVIALAELYRKKMSTKKRA